MEIKVISFDLDGTLVDHSFADAVWHEGMAELYAQKQAIPLHEARERIIRSYSEMGDEALQWYDLGYWFLRFQLPGSPHELLQRYRDRVRMFGDVRDVLERLRGRYRLVLFSNACRDFMQVELEETGLDQYFERTISSVSDFKRVKDPQAYLKLSGLLKIPPREILHIGDHKKFDFSNPSTVGINSILINRDGKRPEGIKDLKKLLEVLEG